MRVSNVVHAVDTHACGEPERVIGGGVLDVPGKTMFEKMQFLESEADELRQRMLRITGFAQYVVGPEDRFPTGYTVGDIGSS